MRRSPRLLLGLALVACGGQAGADAKTRAAEREAPAAPPASAAARPTAPTPGTDEIAAAPSEPTSADAEARRGRAIEADQKDMSKRSAQDQAQAVAAPAATPPAAADDRPAQFADLEALCAALAHDYVDGTLTDYYRGLRMKTAFGDDLRRRGETSMHPGRILEAGRGALGERPGDPPAPSCAPLFAELDDLE